MQTRDEKKAIATHKAWMLRLKGLSYRAIGAALGVAPITAHKYVKERIAELQELTAETLPQMLEIEVSRLDRILELAEQRLEQEYSEKTAELILKTSARRSALLGLDSATKHIVSSVENLSEGELRNRVSDLVARQEQPDHAKTH